MLFLVIFYILLLVFPLFHPFVIFFSFYYFYYHKLLYSNLVISVPIRFKLLQLCAKYNYSNERFVVYLILHSKQLFLTTAIIIAQQSSHNLHCSILTHRYNRRNCCSEIATIIKKIVTHLKWFRTHLCSSYLEF